MTPIDTSTSGAATTRRAVMEKLHAVRQLDDERIEVSVSEGAVTLAGTARSNVEIMLAARAALRVPDVHVVLNEIGIHAPPGDGAARFPGPR
ncbi:BON domain-containing protein [Nakamurella panacisegetis]|uniref:BON domain-containing protein n=1 Tax=Nakamurella panacisegetis TaxID=1090615 RepID=A0A1H0SWY2_9ACTN|nr:BON domain-containing protein [Nakamurella panacisegetis]SDP46119.1 BON domain-containing protein [Nakamurella panacisegetis]